jgi:hypothetical protein
MIRALFLLIVSFISITTYGQKPFKYAGRGIQMTEMWADSVARIPSDTVRNKTGIVRIGVRFFVGNGVYWKEIAGGSSAPSGLSGAIVTQIDSTRFNVSPGSYYIQGSLYANGDTTFNLAQPGDTSRIDVIGLDTSGRVFTITGVESENPYPSSIDPLSQIYLSFVWVDTDTVYFAPTPVNYWSALGNDIINNNPGKVQFTNGIIMDQIANTGSLFYTSRQLVLQSNRSIGARILAGRIGGNVDLNTTELQLSLGDNSTTGTAKTALSLTGRSLHASGSEAMNMLSITPLLVQSGSYTGTVRGIYYNPTVTANVGTHYAFESTLGRIKFGGMETGDTTNYKPLGIDASGNVRKLSSWPSGGGGGGVGTLQQVTDLGATTTNNIGITGTFNNTYIDGSDTWRLINDPGDDLYMGYENSVSGETRTTRAGEINTITSTSQVNRILLNTETPFFGITSTNRLLNFTPNSINLRQGNHLYFVPANASSGVDTFALQNDVADSMQVLRGSLQVLRDSLAAYRAEDTVYTSSGIETVYSGDSTTIRLPYKSWVALISQSGTDAPTAIVLQNDFDETFTFTYSSVGEYRIESANNNFTTDKTFIVTQNTNDGAAIYHFSTTYVNDARIVIYSFDGGSALSDSLLNKSSIEIRVFY